MFLRDDFQIRRPMTPGLRRTIMATYLTFEYLLGLIEKKKIQVTFVIKITRFSWTVNSWLRQAFRRPGEHPKQKRWWATRAGTAARWQCRACAFNVGVMGNVLLLYTYRINWQDLSLVQDSLVYRHQTYTKYYPFYTIFLTTSVRSTDTEDRGLICSKMGSEPSSSSIHFWLGAEDLFHPFQYPAVNST